MMNRLTKTLLIAGMALFGSGPMANGQTLGVSEGAESSTAILDTKVLFAIGAREAEQAIRGSFGWPTFQEGFVDGVYFRFDPDGYARFSSSPRLDEDVFEVQCANASTACIAKKTGIEIGLSPEGRVQLIFPGITPGDSFFVSDRKSELPLPPSILEPLDARLETLLSSGGELIVKREVETLQVISLSGFSAVSTYLRWVAQGQSPRVFPRGWPVPAQSNLQQTSGLTQPSEWVSPNGAPQAATTTWGVQTNNAQQTFNGGLASTQGFNQAGNPPMVLNVTTTSSDNPQVQQMQSTVQALQAELQLLRAQGGLAQQQAGLGNDPSQEDGQTFAQQAQARNLPTPSGYPLPQGGQGQIGYRDFDQTQTASPWPDPNQVVATSRFGQPGPAIAESELEYRIQILEMEFKAMRRDFQSQMNQLRWAQSPNQHQMGEPTMPSAQTGLHASNRQVTAPSRTMHAEKDQAAKRLDMLEKLLMERLAEPQAPRDTAFQQDQNAPTEPTVNLEKGLVEELLKNLDADATQQSATEPAATAEKPAEITTDTSAQKEEGFVTLSDYLNKVLKSEGLDAAPATQ